MMMILRGLKMTAGTSRSLVSPARSSHATHSSMLQGPTVIQDNLQALVEGMFLCAFASSNTRTYIAPLLNTH